MDVVWFDGQLVPKGNKLTVPDRHVHCKSQLDLKDIHPKEFDLFIRIVNSEISVRAELDEYAPSMLNTLFIQVNKLTTAVADLASFSSGIAWRVNLDTFRDHNGVETEIRIADETLASSNMPLHSVGELIPLLLANASLMIALNDLIQTIISPDLVVVNSARSVEGVRNLIDSSEDRNKSWASMRKALNISENYLKLITETAKAPRHGNWAYVPAETNHEIVGRAWSTMDRYIAYVLKDETPLDIEKFPLL